MTFSSELFTLIPEQREFVAEASDLNMIGKVFGSIQIKSRRTGQDAEFIYSHQNISNDGDLTQWTYVPTLSTVLKYPRLTDWKVHIFND